MSVDAKCCMRYNEVIARCMAESQNRSLKENGGNNMAGKKNILTYEGLKALEDELQDLKVNKRKEVAVKTKKPVNRVTYQRMPSMMPQKTNSVISRSVSKRLITS